MKFSVSVVCAFVCFLSLTCIGPLAQARDLSDWAMFNQPWILSTSGIQKGSCADRLNIRTSKFFGGATVILDTSINAQPGVLSQSFYKMGTDKNGRETYITRLTDNVISIKHFHKKFLFGTSQISETQLALAFEDGIPDELKFTNYDRQHHLASECIYVADLPDYKKPSSSCKLYQGKQATEVSNCTFQQTKAGSSVLNGDSDNINSFCIFPGSFVVNADPANPSPRSVVYQDLAIGRYDNDLPLNLETQYFVMGHIQINFDGPFLPAILNRPFSPRTMPGIELFDIQSADRLMVRCESAPI